MISLNVVERSLLHLIASVIVGENENNTEPDALKEWKINIFKIIDTRLSFYSLNTHILPLNRNLKRGIQDFYINYVLVQADKAANNVLAV